MTSARVEDVPPAGPSEPSGRLGVPGTSGRWLTVVVVSVLVPAGLVLLHAPSGAVVGGGIAIALLGIGDLVAEIIHARRVALRARLDARFGRLRSLLAHDILDYPTHGPLRTATEALTAARDRMAAVRGSDDPDLATIINALDVVEHLDRDIRDSTAVRAGWMRHGVALTLGGLAAQDPINESGDLMRLYSDPANLPGWLQGPRKRDALTRIGAVLDDVRLLHNAQIEWAVLLFTMWARLILVGSAPLLAGATFGRVPLDGGVSIRDIPWMLAAVCSGATALGAPWLAHTVMRRDEQGARTRRTLLLIEVPVCVAAILTAPCWAVAVFAAGWTNWWQRPVFDWVRLGVWIAAVVGCIAAGMVLSGDAGLAIVGEAGIAMAVIGVVGGSYGAMFPVSASVLASVVFGGIVSPHRARRTADAQLSSAIKQLLDAAQVIESRAAPGDQLAARDVGSLRDVAGTLAAGADAGDRWARRAPLGLEAAVDAALEKGGPAHGTPRAALLSELAARCGDPEPVTVLPANYYDDDLPHLRFRERADARVLSLLIVEIVGEARAHGTGPLVTRCHAEGDRLVLRFANVARPGPQQSGRGSGGQRLHKLASAIPGAQLDVRDWVAGTFIDLPAPARRFGVQVSLPLERLEAARPSAVA